MSPIISSAKPSSSPTISTDKPSSGPTYIVATAEITINVPSSAPVKRTNTPTASPIIPSAKPSSSPTIATEKPSPGLSTIVNDCDYLPFKWHDPDGSNYDCAWYAALNRCSLYGDSYPNFGKTANEACCACGGGSQSVCQNIQGWYDSDGVKYDCSWYSQRRR